MKTITNIIRKVAEQASKLVLFSALVGGVSMMSYATETTVGPTSEKAQLETVHINLDAVVTAITKADPDWAKGLPIVKKLSTNGTIKPLDTLFWYKVDDQNRVESYLGQVPDIESATGGCDNMDDELCAAGYETDPGLAIGDPIPSGYTPWNKAP